MNTQPGGLGPRPVRAGITAQLRIPGTTQTIALHVTLTYRKSDPHAVRAGFHTGQDQPVEWVFARDLLQKGTEKPAGDGDVRIFPGENGLLGLQISSPYGQARFDLPSGPVAGFLRQTYQLVPAGEEQDVTGKEIDGLFRPGGVLYENGRHA